MGEMNEKTKLFLDDLKGVCQKHGVTLDESDNYDGNEQYCGTDYTFTSSWDEKEENYLISVDIKDIGEYISHIEPETALEKLIKKI